MATPTQQNADQQCQRQSYNEVAICCLTSGCFSTTDIGASRNIVCAHDSASNTPLKIFNTEGLLARML